MNENDRKTDTTIAQLSESAGMIFCIAGVLVLWVLLTSGIHTGLFGFAMAMSAGLPTLGAGLLLLVAGRILRAVSGKDNSPTE